MKISVIVPVYNVERYLERCLRSVEAAARQFVGGEKGRSVEVICVNDGSTDRSPAILVGERERFSSLEGVNFVVVDKPNGGLGSARNAGLDRMTGDYVMFVDSDDYIPSCALSVFASVATASGASIVISTSFRKDSGRGVSEASPAKVPRWRVRPSSWIAGRKVQYSAWNKFYRADLLRNRRFSNEVRYFEDYPFTTQLFCAVATMAFVDEPLYVYCINPSATSLIHSPFSERKLRDSAAGIRAILDHARGTSAERFARRQAGDGLSSTIGKVWKVRNPDFNRKLLAVCDDLFARDPKLRGSLSLKAKVRLLLIRWKTKTRAVSAS